MRRLVALSCLAIAATATGAAGLALATQPPVAGPSLDAQRDRLRTAKAQAAAADARARELDRLAAAARDGARAAAARQAATEARIRAAQADIAAGRARIVLVERALADARDRLADRQGVIVRLVAALQSLASRPSVLSIAQPGSTSDIVHVRAVLGTVTPVIAARSADVRREVEQVRRLRGDAGRAVAALTASRDRLDARRLELVALEAEQRLRSRRLAQSALRESDRALALAEEARELVETIDETRSAGEIAADLSALAGPLPRPRQAGEGDPGVVERGVYRLPVVGRVVGGLGAASDAGVRARGLTLAVAPGAGVVAPAAGQVIFAGPFRSYGRIVILDHGSGWTTLIAGMDAIDVARGDHVGAGAAVGRAGARDDGRIMLELRRNGVPVDVAALVG
ncbi:MULTISPECIES: murein hydrolase activator EnvC family protein [unclassified Sphingomonas]|uniref:murein hydrolase activator EnvC family protein n=1 Tax=unclassified Sphingomonas TaxID=196159 RepID=UPI0009E777E7|nr:MULTISPECIES: peptidoglycan DD-metalloendopeptidase family protein [unclassified Sphingomonas]